MIPVDDDGELVGTKVYVPKSLYQQLSAAPQIDREIPMAQIVNSRYALSLIRSAESTGNVDLVKIDATWTLLVPPNGQEIFLPVAPETVQHLEFSEPGLTDANGEPLPPRDQPVCICNRLAMVYCKSAPH